MQIVIPMSGFGERFRKAGYSVPKPLIEIEGKPIIAHVIDMFPGETNFVFICNEDHLGDPNYRMREILAHYCPTGRIAAIPPHKLGPVHAVLLAESLLDPNQPTVVNYCDFTCYWDWSHFKTWASESKCDGAIPAYKGFHPHTLGTTNYAYMKEQGGWVQDIQEKKPYTDNRMEEYASSGTYYFSSGARMLEAFKTTVEQNLNVGGEFYVSLTYKPLLAGGAKIGVYPLQHFMQWGTPEDVAEYNYWSSTFRKLTTREHEATAAGTIVVPMAGMGERFRREGYLLPKPLIEVSGVPMVIQATRDLPAANQYAFVLRKDMPGVDEIQSELLRCFPSAIIELVDTVTEGQACTAALGLNAVETVTSSASTPVTFGVCDNGVIFDETQWNNLITDPDVDVIVWSISGYVNAARNPQMYGWLDVQDGKIRAVSVKTPLQNPSTDPIVLGTFTFKRTEDFRRCVERMIQRNARINGEFYLDTCINDAIELGLRCVTLNADAYLAWGTPNDLRTFEYWQSCFDKWSGHPYNLANDARVDKSALPKLRLRYSAPVPQGLK